MKVESGKRPNAVEPETMITLLDEREDPASDLVVDIHVTRDEAETLCCHRIE